MLFLYVERLIFFNFFIRVLWEVVFLFWCYRGGIRSLEERYWLGLYRVRLVLGLVFLRLWGRIFFIKFFSAGGLVRVLGGLFISFGEVDGFF